MGKKLRITYQDSTLRWALSICSWNWAASLARASSGVQGLAPRGTGGGEKTFIAIGTLEGDRRVRNVVGRDECGHLVSHLTTATVRAISMCHRTLGAESPRLPSEPQWVRPRRR
jgi:hypothetical protein